MLLLVHWLCRHREILWMSQCETRSWCGGSWMLLRKRKETPNCYRCFWYHSWYHHRRGPYYFSKTEKPLPLNNRWKCYNRCFFRNGSLSASQKPDCRSDPYFWIHEVRNKVYFITLFGEVVFISEFMNLEIRITLTYRFWQAARISFRKTSIESNS